MNAQEIRNALLNVKPFQYLDLHELDLVISYCEIVDFNNGDILFYQGQKSRGLYSVIKGKALIAAKTLGNTVVNLKELEAGDFIGEVSLLRVGPCAASVVADGPLQCLLVTTEYFEMLGTFYPSIRKKIIKAIIEEVTLRVEDLHRKIDDLISSLNISTMSVFDAATTTFSKAKELNAAGELAQIEYLRKSPALADITDTELNILLNHSQLFTAEKNCELMKQQNQQYTYFFLLHGAVSIKIIKKSKISKLAVFGPQTFFCPIRYPNVNLSKFSYISCEKVIFLKTAFSDVQDVNINLANKLENFACKHFVMLERQCYSLKIRLISETYNYV